VRAAALSSSGVKHDCRFRTSTSGPQAIHPAIEPFRPLLEPLLPLFGEEVRSPELSRAADEAKTTTVVYSEQVYPDIEPVQPFLKPFRPLFWQSGSPQHPWQQTMGAAMPDAGGNHGVEEKPQTAWGAWVVIVGLFAVVGIFALAVTLTGLENKDVATVVGAAFGVIGALVGAYFGIRGTTVATAQTMNLMTKELGAKIDQTKEASKEAQQASEQTRQKVEEATHAK